LAVLYTKLNNIKQALLYYETCLKIDENNLESLIGISSILSKLKQYDLSIDFAMRAYKLYPENINVINCLYLGYYGKRDWESAITYAKKIIELEPENDLGYGCIANVYFEAVGYSEALEFYNKALTYKSDDFDYLYNKAACLSNINHSDEAIMIVDKLFKTNFNKPNLLNLSCMVKLKNKYYNEAKEQYLQLISPVVMHKLKKEDDTLTPNIDSKFVEYYKNNWQNDNNCNLKNKTLLLYNYAGLGDYMMFSRYIPIITNKWGKVIVEVNKNLYGLFKRNFDNVDVVQETDAPYTNYDYTASIMSLLYSAGLDFEHIPFSSGWLNADNKLVEQFKNSEIFNQNKKIKAGIFWHGNTKILKNRSINLEELTILFKNDNFSFYSLDIEKKEEKDTKLLNDFNIIDCSQYINTFEDTAAILKNLDVLITVDSSVCHLAGAMGVKTFLMLPNNAEWRWFYNTEKTPWYDSIRIF
ncbi:MAG: hypothetical protein LUH05_01520, partial [Candidatus Gastranaerophilales bacterium]|nr:hypothetical protein [Candidatus Gastranaerophilales bacterium]